jgi:hypothetical protein
MKCSKCGKHIWSWQGRVNRRKNNWVAPWGKIVESWHITCDKYYIEGHKNE